MEQGRRMLKRHRGEGDDSRRGQDQQQRLYLIFDDWAWGYINLQSLQTSPPSEDFPASEDFAVRLLHSSHHAALASAFHPARSPPSAPRLW
jgi:hypothetical protein